MAKTRGKKTPKARTRKRRAPRTPAGLLTRRELAAQVKNPNTGTIGVHPMTITKWEQSGMPIASRGTKGRPSRYQLAEVAAWIETREQQARETAAGKAAAGADGLNLGIERALLAREQALLARQSRETKAGLLLPVADVDRAWRAEVRAVRSIIQSFPQTHADRIHRASVTGGVEGAIAALESLADEILRELSNPDRAISVAS